MVAGFVQAKGSYGETVDTAFAPLDVEVTLDDAPTEGNLLIAVRQSSVTVGGVVSTIPTGWARQRVLYSDTNDLVEVLTRVVEEGDTADLGIWHIEGNNDSLSSDSSSLIGVAEYAGHVSLDAVGAATQQSGTSFTAAGVTALGESRLVFCGATRNLDFSATPPEGMDERLDITHATFSGLVGAGTVYMADEAVSAGATGDKAATMNTSSTVGWACLVASRESDGGGGRLAIPSAPRTPSTPSIGGRR